MPSTVAMIGKRDDVQVDARSSNMAPTEFVRRHMHSHAARFHHSHGHAASHEHVVRDPLAIRSSDMPADGDEGSSTTSSSDNMIDILITVFGIAFLVLIALSMFMLFRRYQRVKQLQQQQNKLSAEKGSLPPYDAAKNPHGLTIETTHQGRSSVLYISRDGQPMLQNPHSPPHSPDNVPQIHITFPDEHDDEGRRTSGRVLVVRVGDNATIGLEPVQEEQLPAYEKDSKSQFYSIDMDHIGGLKEKDPALFQ
jgi:hypothetical protein